MNTPLRRILVGLALAFVLQPSASQAQQAPTIPDPYRRLVVEPDRNLDHEKGYRSQWFELHGYLRTRADFVGNSDLGVLKNGSALSRSEDWIESANMRLRFEPTVHLGREAAIHVTLDFLDNLVLGSTPDAGGQGSMAPAAGGAISQAVPAAGVNSWRDAIRLKKAYLEVSFPLGLILVGRMGNNWGMGLVTSAGDELDDDYDDLVDRIGFVTSLWDHVIALSFDFNANGPSTAGRASSGQALDLTDQDDVRTVSVGIARMDLPEMLKRRLQAGRTTVNYGAAFSYRWQKMDLPNFYQDVGDSDRAWQTTELVRRDFDAFLLDAWLRLIIAANGWTLRLEGEGAYSHGSVKHPDPLANAQSNFELTSDQGALVGRFEVQPARLPLWFGLHAGWASGDPAPGFGVYSKYADTGIPVLPQAGDIDGSQIQLSQDPNRPHDTSIDNFRCHPNYHIDEILWRRIVGTFTDGWFLRGDLRYYPLPSLKLSAGAIYSQTLYAMSAPGLARPLGVELNLGATYYSKGGFEARFVYAVLFPLSGLRDYFEGIDPQSAHLFRLALSYRM